MPYHVPLPKDARKPLPGELPPERRRLLRELVVGTLLVGVGAVLGVVLSPETPRAAAQRIAALEGELAAAKRHVGELEWAVKHPQPVEVSVSGKLKAADRARHEREAKRYAGLLRKAKAQGAAELVSWFVGRWDSMLDAPTHNDRTGRRAELLALLVGGMAANLNPGDYVPWQAEFLGGEWLGDLHFDLDGDGYPGKRSMPNPHDGFANVSVCQIAMAMNETVRDARVLVMPEMSCDRPEARMSVFLQGTTVDDAITDLVRALQRDGFLVVEKIERGVRLVLVGPGTRGAPRGEAP
jgi:hypothetical protein